MNIPEHIIDKHLFKISDKRLDMLARLFIHHDFHEQYGWHFCEFVYKYELGIYDNQFPYTGRGTHRLGGSKL